jgi:hypothetical protein
MLETRALMSNILRAGIKVIVSKSDEPQHILEGMQAAVDGRIYLSPLLNAKLLCRNGEPQPAHDDPVAKLGKRELEVLLKMWHDVDGNALSIAVANKVHYQIRERYNMTVIESLADRQFLPRYGFPIGVQRLKVRLPPEDGKDPERREEDQYRLERPSLLALPSCLSPRRYPLRLARCHWPARCVRWWTCRLRPAACRLRPRSLSPATLPLEARQFRAQRQCPGHWRSREGTRCWKELGPPPWLPPAVPMSQQEKKPPPPLLKEGGPLTLDVVTRR